MKKITVLIIISLLLLSISGLKAQNPNNVLIHNINYNAQNQDMWGPGNSFSFDFDYDIIDISWNEADTISSYTNVFGQTFGIGLDYGFWGVIKSTFSIHGFSGGSIDINYPVEVILDFPDDYGFDHGETVNITSSYEVLNGYYLHSDFPSGGVVALDLEYGLGMHMNLTIEMFGTTNVPLIPEVNVPSAPVPGQPLPHDSIPVFYLNSQNGNFIYPCLDTVTGLPGFCNDTLLPINIPDWFNIGLSGEIDLPDVQTNDWLDTNTNCLHAYGQDKWIDFELDILEFLNAIASVIPPPAGPALSNALNVINGGTVNYDVGPVSASIDYYLLQISFAMSSWMTQEFDFCPTIWAVLGFPVDLPYAVNEPSGNTIDQGVSDTVRFALNNNVDITYPCHDWDSMDISVDYDITPSFSNHTWDSLAFDFIYSVVWASIEITLETPFKADEVPEFTIPVSYNDSATGKLVTKNITSPSLEAPEIDLSNYLEEDEYIHPQQIKNGQKDITIGPFTIGPLLQDSVPMGYIPITWFDDSWDMQGFYDDDDTVFEGTNIIPLPELDAQIQGNNILCYGDSSGVITVTAQNSTGPYTFEYSNGVSNTHMNPVDSIYVSAGYYYVTVSDTYDCEVVKELNVTHLYPPIISQTSGDDVLCHGDATGNLYAQSSGGAPSHSYYWDPPGVNQQNVTGVYAGWHYLTVTDSVGCTHEDSVYIDEPQYPLGLNYTYTNVSCHGGNDGALDITVTGGTPPYSYQWSNGFTSEDLINVQADDYTVTITDENSCTYDYIMAVIEPDPLITNISSTNVSCYGGNDGSVDLVVSGGNKPYSYQWSCGDTTQDIDSVSAGIYIVTVTDAKKCQTYEYVQLEEPDLPLTAEINAVNISCFDSGDGYAEAHVFGGTKPYFFNWSNGEIGQSTDSLKPGTYYLTVNDNNNCKTYDSVTISEPSQSLTVSGKITDVTCGNGSDGEIDITVSGGTPPYHYVWSNGSWMEDLENVEAGNYSVTVTDDNGCENSYYGNIDEPQPLELYPPQDTTICFGQNVKVGFNMITGGTPPYEIIWEHDNSVTTNFINVSPENTTTYKARIIDAAGCKSNSASFTVSVKDSLKFSVVTEIDSVCPGDIVPFVFNISGGGGEPYEIYAGDSSINASIYKTKVYKDTIFRFTAWDDCHSDSIYIEYPVNLYELPPVSIVADKTEGCQPLTVHFNEESPYQGQNFLWNFDDGDVENLSFARSPSHTFYNATVYDVNLVVTSVKGCKRDSTVRITVHPKPDPVFQPSATNVTMEDPKIDFTNFTEGMNFYTWDFGDGTTSDSDDINVQHVYPSPGKYVTTLIAETLYGCLDTASIDITVSGKMNIYAPTAFSPNGDNKNEEFKISVIGVDKESYHLEIYNRWGEKIFVSDNEENGWDGTYHDKDSPQGIYTWYLTFDDYYGNMYEKSGKVTLIR